MLLLDLTLRLLLPRGRLLIIGGQLFLPPSRTAAVSAHEEERMEQESDPDSDRDTEYDHRFAARIEARVHQMAQESLAQAETALDRPLEAEVMTKNSAASVDLFNEILRLEVWPERWCVGLICPIYKRAGDESDLDNYRPITLLSIVSKLFEILLNTRLMEWRVPSCLTLADRAHFSCGEATRAPPCGRVTRCAEQVERPISSGHIRQTYLCTRVLALWLLLALLPLRLPSPFPSFRGAPTGEMSEPLPGSIGTPRSVLAAASGLSDEQKRELLRQLQQQLGLQGGAATSPNEGENQQRSEQPDPAASNGQAASAFTPDFKKHQHFPHVASSATAEPSARRKRIEFSVMGKADSVRSADAPISCSY